MEMKKNKAAAPVKQKVRDASFWRNQAYLEVCPRDSYNNLKESGKLAELEKVVEFEKKKQRAKRPMYKVDKGGLIELDVDEFIHRKAWRN